MEILEKINWSIEPMEKIISHKGLIRGPFGGALKKEFFKEKGYAVYEQRNVIYNEFENCRYFIDETKFEELNRFKIRSNDLLVSCSGTIGKLAEVPTVFKNGIINQALMIIRLNEELIDREFFKQQFGWSVFQRKIMDNTQGGAMKNMVGMSEFKRIKVLLPPLPEQQKIANMLSDWDTAIENEQTHIKTLELRKKGLMQQLLTGKKRLPGFSNEWQEDKLGNYFTERKDTGYDNLELLSVGRNGVYPQDSEKKDTSNSNKSKYKRICVGDIGYNTMRMWQGRSALSSLEGIVSPAYTILKPKEHTNSVFFSYLFKLEEMIHKFYRNSQGMVSDTWMCKFKDLSIIKFQVPHSKDEQTAIADILLTADKEIEKQQNYLKQLQAQKKGLTQQLLTGKIRVKI